MGGPSVDERSFRQGARERCAGFGTSAGVGPGARGLARGLDSTVGIGTSNEATRTQRRFRTRVQGGGRRASVIGMGTWNVTTKCRQGWVEARAAGVEMISDKCGGWAWCEGIGKGIDLTVGDLERSDQAPISDKGPRRR